MKYQGNLNFRIGIMLRLIKGIKKGVSFLIQKIIKKKKTETDKEKLKRMEERFEKLRNFEKSQLKLLAMAILRYQLSQNLDSHFEEIEEKVSGIFNVKIVQS